MRTKYTTTLFRRLGAWALTLALVVGLLPQTAFAAGTDTGKAIQLGASNISGYDSTNGYAYIYYGTWSNSPIKWRVLSMNGNSGTYSDGTDTVDASNAMFLLSDGLLGTGSYGGVYFDSTSPYSDAWQGSDAQTWCSTFFSTNLTAQEQGAVLATTKNDSEYTSKSSIYSNYKYGASSLSADKVFFLSAQEVETTSYGFSEAGTTEGNNTRVAYYNSMAGRWWLRSPYAGRTNYAGFVESDGHVSDYRVAYDWAARPAFNLNLNSVLFTSAAEGSKTDSTVDGNLTEVAAYNGSEWKLTLLDSNRNGFSASTTSATTQVENYSNWTVEVTYFGAQTGSNEYVSAMIVDSSNDVLYYGRVAQNSASGTASITIPTGLTPGSYTLKVFSEQYNGDKMTDYASQFVDIPLTVTDATPPTLTEGTATRTGEATATVTFTSSEAGTYYYAVVESSADAPADLTTNGTSGTCVTGTNTISVTGLSGLGAKDIYIVVKDVAENVSQPLKIGIPAYVAPTYTISASPTSLPFGSAEVGYTTAPAAQTVTIQNTGNQTVTLNTPTSTGSDFVIGELSATELAPNDTATFTVQPNTGLVAGNYEETITVSGTGGGQSTNTVQITATFAVNAATPTYYTIGVSASPESAGTVAGGGEYEENTQATVTATASDASYSFVEWQENGSPVSESAEYTFTVDRNRELTAVFEENTSGGDEPEPSHTHTLAYRSDASGHWQECTANDCPDADKGKTTTEAHVYDSDTDTTCNICGYTRTIEDSGETGGGSGGSGSGSGSGGSGGSGSGSSGDDESGGDTTPTIPGTGDTPYVTYTVQRGDTLWAISRRYGCTVAEIVAANSELIKNPNLIYPGWQLQIPQGGAAGTQTPESPDALLPDRKYLFYTVKRGDTLWAISRKYGCTVSEIVALNGELIKNPDLIFAGWELKIPQD